MFILPIQRKKRFPKIAFPLTKHPSPQIETKFTQFPEIEKSITKPVHSLVKQYIFDSQLLTNAISHSQPIRTQYFIKSFSVSKAREKKTSSTQLSSLNQKDTNTSNDYSHYASYIKSSFSNRLLSYNSNNVTCDEKNKKETTGTKTNPSTDTSSGNQIAKRRKRHLFVFNEKRKAHDVNVYNRIYSNENLQNNYARNAYKIAKIFQNERFVNQIKLHLKTMKFNNQLKQVDT